MKKYLKLFVFLVLTSCTGLSFEHETEYNKFTISDYEFIPEMFTGKEKIIKYKNQYGDEVRFVISGSQIEKKEEGVPMSSSFSLSNKYYDILTSNATLPDFIFPEEDNINTSLKIEYSATKGRNDTIYHSIYIPEYIDSTHRIVGDFFRYQTPEIEDYKITEIEINNKIYSNVLIFTDTYYPFSLSDIDSKIHLVYYDYKEGILGFSDTINNINFWITN